MLGKLVYFCDLKSGTVKQGHVVTSIINAEGYVVNIIISHGIRFNVENDLIFDKQADADKKLVSAMEQKAKMEQYNKETTEVLNQMRTKVIGEPEFKELANELRIGQN